MIKRKNEYTCLLGFEIFGLKEAKTKAEKIEAIENHMRFIDGAFHDAYGSLENKLSELKYGTK